MDFEILRSSGNQDRHCDTKATSEKERDPGSQENNVQKEITLATHGEAIRTYGSKLNGSFDYGAGTLIPGLTDDVAVLCLIRVPREFIPVLRKVCTSWKRLVENEEYPMLRKEEISSEGCLWEILTRSTTTCKKILCICYRFAVDHFCGYWVASFTLVPAASTWLTSNSLVRSS
eukprot:Gb_09353 [translate_table: standard]